MKKSSGLPLTVLAADAGTALRIAGQFYPEIFLQLEVREIGHPDPSHAAQASARGLKVFEVGIRPPAI